MDFIRKTVASLALFAMGMTFVAPVSAAARLGFTDDVEIPSWAEEAIEELMDQGVISGNDDGSFAPNRQLNRAEVSKVIVLSTGIDFDTTGGPHFPDVQPSAWYYDYIETMYNYGWVNGYPDGLFRPGVGINRSEIAKMVVNAFELEEDLSGAPHFDDVDSGDWFYSYVETAYNYNLMRGFGDGTFGPANPVTRAETTKIVYDGQLAAFPIDEGLAEGTIEVTLSDDTPRGTNVPYNATSVPYTTVELTASDDADVEVSAVTFTRLGLGDNDDFDNVWIEIDGFKVGNDKSVNNDDIVELRFNPPVVVPAGQTLVADVVASAKHTSTDQNIGHHNRFALVSADDIVSTASNIVGDFPIEGEEMEVADYEVSQIQFSSLGADTTVDVGDNFIEIGKFRMLNTSNTNKDVELRAITFKNDGTAELEDNLENVGLYVSGEQVSAESIIDGDYVTFRLDNGVTGGYIIEDGDSRIFSLRADIVSAEASDTIAFKIDNFEDIVGVEIGTSFGVKAVDSSGNNAEDSNATLKTYTIDSGDLNVSRDPSSIGNQEYAPGSNDVVLLTARLVVDQPLLVDGVYIDLDSVTLDGDESLANVNARFDNFRLFLNDKLIDTENDFEDTDGTTADFAASGDYRLNFNTTFEIAGTSILKLVTNVQDDALSTDKIKVKISASDFQSPEYISTGDQVSSSQLLGSAEGSFLEVQASILSISETSGLSNDDKIVAGVDDVTFLEFVLDNNDSGDVNVTSVTLQADTDAGDLSGSTRDYSNFTAAVFVDGTQQGSAKNLSSTGGATFNDLSVLIPSSQQKEFVVVVDTIESSADALASVVADGAHTSATTTSIAVDALTTAIADNETIEFAGGARVTVNGAAAVADTSITVDSVDLSGTSIADDEAGSVSHLLKLDVTDVDADNVENGQTVTVNEGGAELTTSNVLDGVRFELVSSGSLTVSSESQVYSDLLVAGAEDVEILRIRFAAADDEVQIKDIYLTNDQGVTAGDRVDFKLYDANGQLIQEKQMVSGDLHFELGNNERIRVPKDDSTFVSVKVDVRDISKANQTGARLVLALDTAGDVDTAPYEGIEAVTAATGNDIANPSAGWGDVVGNEFVAYRTQVAVRHAATQPSYQVPVSAVPVYRFGVTADSAYDAEIAEVTFNIQLSGGLCNLDTDGDDSCDNVADVLLAGNFEVVRLENDGVTEVTSGASTGITEAIIADATGVTATGKQAVLSVVFDTPETIARGTTEYYAIKMSGIEDVNSTDETDRVSVTILKDSAYDAPAASADQEGTNADQANRGNDIVWSDRSSTSHSQTTLDWLNGYLLDTDTDSAGMSN